MSHKPIRDDARKRQDRRAVSPSSLLATVIVLLLLPTPSLLSAQESEVTIKRPEKVVLDGMIIPDPISHIQRIPLKAQNFTPSDFRNKRTGEIPERIRLTNGEMVDLDLYLEELNAAERDLSEQGISLRHPSEEVKMSHMPVKESELRLQRSRLRRMDIGKQPSRDFLRGGPEFLRDFVVDKMPPLSRRDELRSLGRELRTASRARTGIRTLGQVEVDDRIELPSEIRMDQDRIRKANRLSERFEDSWSFGESEVAEVEMGTNLSFLAMHDKVQIQGAAWASGTLFSERQELLRVSAGAGSGAFVKTLDGETRNSTWVRLRVEALDDVVFAFRESLSHGDDVTRQHTLADWPLEIPAAIVPLGPATISLTFGVGGGASIGYGMGVDALHASAHVRTSADLHLTGKASVDLHVADAGITGRLTVIDATVGIEGSVGVEPGDGNAVLRAEVGIPYELRFLDGHLTAFLTYPAPADFWNPFDWEEKRLTTEIWSWEGFEDRGTLWSETFESSLY